MEQFQNNSILIVSDSVERIEVFKRYIAKHVKTITKTHTAQTLKNATTCLLQHAPTIVLLEIESTNEADCFELLSLVPSNNTEIIIVSSSAEYAVQAINTTQIIGYVLKPLKPAKLTEALERAISNIMKKSVVPWGTAQPKSYSDFIAIPSASKVDIVSPKDILYLEANGRYTIFHLAGGTHKVASRNIGEYEGLLNSEHFFRIHHGYIVNLNMVCAINKSAGNYCEMSNKKLLPIAKRRQDELSRFLHIK